MGIEEQLEKTPSEESGKEKIEPVRVEIGPFRLTEEGKSLLFSGARAYLGGEIDKAKELWEKAKASDKSYDIFHAIADLLMQIGNPALAAANLEEAVSNNLANVVTFRTLKKVYGTIDNLGKYYASLEKILETGEATSDEYGECMIQHMRQGDNAGAISVGDRAIAESKQDSDIYAHYLYALGRLGKHKKAITLGKKIFEQGRQGQWFYGALMHQLNEEKRHDEAIEVGKRAIDEGETSKTVYGKIMYALNEKEMYDEAIDIGKRAVKERKADTAVFRRMMYAFSRKNMLEEVIETGKKAVEIEEADEDMGILLLSELNKRKRFDEAIISGIGLLRQGQTNSDFFSRFTNALFAKGEQDMIIEAGKIAIRERKTSGILYENLIHAFNKKGKHLEAIVSGRTAMEENKATSFAYRFLISSLNEEKMFDEAVKVGRRAIDEGKATPEIYGSLTYSFGIRNMHEESMAIAQRAIAEKKADSLVYLNLAISLGALNKPEEVINTGRKAIEEGMGCDKLYGILMSELNRQRKHTESIEIGERAILKGEAGTETYSSMTYALNEEKRFNDTIQIGRRAIAEGNTGEIVYGNTMHAMSEVGRQDDVIEVGEKAIAEKKAGEVVYAKLAGAYLEKDKYDELNKMLEGMEESKVGLFFSSLLANSFAKARKPEKAIETLEQLRKRPSAGKEIFNALIHLYGAKNNSQKVVEVAEDACKRDAYDLGTLACLAIACENTGEHQKAIDYLEGAIQKGMTDEVIYGNLAMHYIHNGEKKKARQTIAAAIRKFPEDISPNVPIKLLRCGICGWTDFIRYKLSGKIKSKKRIFHPEDYSISEMLTGASNIQKKKWVPNFLKQIVLEGLIEKVRERGVEFGDLSFDFKHSTNKVYTLPATDFSSVLAIKEGHKPYDEEKAIRDSLEGILGKEHVPEYVSHFGNKGKFYYIMRFKEGKTLTDAIKDGSLSAMKYGEFVGILAKMHALTPIANLAPYELKRRLEQKNERAGMPPEFNASCSPVVACLSKSGNLCYNSDSGTDNWILGAQDQTIVKIDTENKGKVPYAFDLAHFLNAIPYLKFEDRLGFVKAYMDSVNRIGDYKGMPYRMITDSEKFMREYLNSTIYRALAGGAYLMSKFRPDDEQAIYTAGIDTIEFMQQNGMIKKGCKKQYSEIKDALKALSE